MAGKKCSPGKKMKQNEMMMPMNTVAAPPKKPPKGPKKPVKKGY